MTTYELSHQRDTVFPTALHVLFHSADLFYEEPTGILFVYLDEEKTKTSEERYKLCDYFFRDMTLETDVMWHGERFGIVGWDDTMTVDQVALV